MRCLLPVLLVLLCAGLVGFGPNEQPRAELYAGAAEIDITPNYPIRLSGFGGRRAESEGVTQNIYAKALVLGVGGQWHALVVIDNLGLDALHLEAARTLLAIKLGEKKSQLTLTVSATHTHTAPMLTGVCPTIFGAPIPQPHMQRIEKYTHEAVRKIVQVVCEAREFARPVTLEFGLGSVGFAANRRTKDGPVDHDLPLLVVRGKRDGKLLALYTSYACHAVTQRDNKISGDWPGFAAEHVQRRHPGTICLVAIGCGADSNPTTTITGAQVDQAREQGAQVADEIDRLLGTPLRPITALPQYCQEEIKLPLAPWPSRAEWEERAKKQDAVGHHARFFLDLIKKQGAARPGQKMVDYKYLTNEITYPITTLAFGDQLAMLFLPGEVVVDYSRRLKAELDRHRLWINAYSNDMPGYVPSERILKEGGYEGGGAMVYYGIPAPYAEGLEDKIIATIVKMLGPAYRSPVDSRKLGGTVPLSPQQSLATLRTHPDLEIELVAAEPLITSPVAIDWGLDGKLYVCEMYDYPQGVPGQSGPGGRVRVLSKSRPDGPYDRAGVFLDHIPFPTGITSFRRGLLVCAAPDILYAEDSNGDGKADRAQKLYSGFGTHNFQARVNSLEYGLDGWIYGACGLYGGNILSHKTGQAYPLGNRDFRIKIETGEIEAVQGCTQQGRTRDDWGNWFGCDNSNLAFHYPLQEQYLRRNPYLKPPPAAVLIPEVNKVYPRGQHLVRHERTGPPGVVTSACGLTAYRDNLLGTEYQNCLFVCEPVNLLVHRMILAPKQSTFVGKRAPEEQQSEFLTGADPWFRPVQAKTGPDGALYIVDMHRFVIEHPQWIPFDERQRLDLRAGSTMGRIFRVKAKGKPLRAVPKLDQMKPPELAAALDTPNGWVRDRVRDLLQDYGEAAKERLAGQRSYGDAYTLAAQPNIDLVIKIVLEHADDVYFRAAFDSGIDGATLPRLTKALVEALDARPEPELLHLLERLVRYALKYRERASVQLLLRAAGSANELPHTWRFALLATILREATGPDPTALLAEKPLQEQIAAALRAARAAAADAGGSESHRAAALACLGYDPSQRKEDLALAEGLLAPQNPAALQQAALALLARTEDESAAALLARAWAPLTPALKNEALDLLLARPAWQPALLDHVEQGAIPANQFDAGRRQRLLQSARGDLKARAEKLLAGASRPDRAQLLTEYQDVLTLAADRQRGRAVFNQRCAVCHKLGDAGHAVGPDLAAVVNKSPGYLLQEILDPNRQVDSRYFEYIALLKNGKLAAGILASESSHSITLRAQEGKSLVLLRGDIDELKSSNKSLMPEGMEKDLSRQDLADVIAVLRDLEPTPKAFKGNRPEVVKAQRGGYALLATNAEIHGSSLSYEFPLRNLGMWHGLDDHAGWKVDVAKAGRFDVYLDWSCAPGSAGNTWLLEGGKEPLSGTVPATGGWDRYRRAKVGSIELGEGLQKLTLRAGGAKLTGALLDLRAVHLVPEDTEAKIDLALPGAER